LASCPRDPMALTLSSTDLSRIRAAQDVLLAPLAAPSVEVWGRRVVEALAEVLGAESGLVLLPFESARLVDCGTGRRLAEVFEHYFVEPATAGAPFPDPAITRSTKIRLSRAIRTLSYARLDHFLDGALSRSSIYNEMQAAHPHQDMASLLADLWRDGERVEGAVHLYFDAYSAFGDETLSVQDLLVPAFHAGLNAALDLGARRSAFDALNVPFVVCDVDGRVVHETPALTAALAGDEQGGHIRAEALRLASDLGGDDLAVHPERVLPTARGTYTLRATLLPEGASLGPRPGVLVAVTVPTSPWPASEVLQSRFGLTRREVEVAVLLAQGLPNNSVARALYISPHTARRHTERVMAKLDVPARAQVAAAILADA